MGIERAYHNGRPPRPPHESPWLTTAQTAAYFRISEKTLKRMRKDGTGPPFHSVGRSIRYHIDEVMAWCLTHEQSVTVYENGAQLAFDFMMTTPGDSDAKYP